MKSLPHRIARPLAASVLAALCTTHAGAGEVAKANNTDALNLTTSWSLGTAPTSTDVALWDSTVSAANTVLLGADTSWQGIKLTSPGGAVTISAGNVLTLGSAGIDMSSATQNLTLASGLLLATDQSWNVGTGRTLTISGASTGSTGVITKSGAGILQLNTALSATNGVILSGGTTNASAGNFVNVFGGGLLTFQNGAILTNSMSASNTMTLQSNIVVASGQTGTINLGARTQWGSSSTTYTLTGAGTLNVNANTTVTRDDIYADMTAFTGAINFGGTGPIRLFINGGKVGAGFTGATVDLAGTAFLTPQTNSGGNTINIGALSGTSTTAGLAAGSAGSPNWSVGAKNLDTSFAGQILGNSALTKVGTGSLTLTNTTGLTYTGGTTINNGSVILGASNILLSTGNLALGGGKLDLAGFSQTLGTLTLTAATTSTIDFGSGTATLLFSSITGTGNLNVLNFTEGTDNFNVTADPTALLTKITINGLAATATDMSGYWAITASAVPEPATYAALAGLGILGFAAYRRRRA
jgi:autotransporter-associated beta strand protein